MSRGSVSGALHELGAIDEHNDQVCFMMVDHRFDELRAHPRFDSLLARIGLGVRKSGGSYDQTQVLRRRAHTHHLL